MTTTTAKECSTAECTNPAAFATRTKPARCAACIDDLLREGGLELAEPFTGSREWQLPSCLTCGVQAKVLVDERKSADLLAAGCMVVRLREDDLPPLAINHPRYLELRVYSKAPQPHAVMETVRARLPASPPGDFPSSETAFS